MSYQSSMAGKNWGGVGGAGGTYNYYTGASPTNPGSGSIGNWNTGGTYAGTGNQNGVQTQFGTLAPNFAANYSNMNPMIASSFMRQIMNMPEGTNYTSQPSGVGRGFGGDDPVTTGPIQPALGPQGVPSATPTFPYNNGFNGRPPANYPPTPTPGPMSWPPGSMGHGSTWGGRPVPGSNTTTIPYNPHGGGYTNIPKNNEGNLPGYPGGNGATYGGMGNDFRSSNFSPSSYNPRWQ